MCTFFIRMISSRSWIIIVLENVISFAGLWYCNFYIPIDAKIKSTFRHPFFLWIIMSWIRACIIPHEDISAADAESCESFWFLWGNIIKSNMSGRWMTSLGETSSFTERILGLSCRIINRTFNFLFCGNSHSRWSVHNFIKMFLLAPY